MISQLTALLPLFFSLLLSAAPMLQLQQDIQQDLARLQNGSSYFISDNSSLSPSVQTVAEDLQLFQLSAGLDLSKANHTSDIIGKHRVDSWQLPHGDIKTIYQVESTIHLDTVVTQRYLDNRSPTQQRITNDFTFRSYLISTASEPAKLYYLTEADQGLLSYRLGEKQVDITYTTKKEGLSDILPKYQQEVTGILNRFRRQE